jgi:hypothetical protein
VVNVEDDPDAEHDEFSSFDDLARRLVNVPKEQIDRLRAKEDAVKRPKPSRSARRK